MATEQEILAAIAEAEIDQKEARQKVAYHKMAAIEAESLLITANLKRERLAEELRVWHLRTVKFEVSKEEKDLEDFRARLPELLKKIK